MLWPHPARLMRGRVLARPRAPSRRKPLARIQNRMFAAPPRTHTMPRAYSSPQFSGGSMKKSTVLFAVLADVLGIARCAAAAQPSVNPKDIVELELLTHTEVTEKIKQGNTSVLIITGGTEERGPHNVLGGHTLMSRHRGIAIAQKLGNTLLAPVLDFRGRDRPARKHRSTRRRADARRCFQRRAAGDDREHGVQRLQGHLRDGRSRRRPAADQGSRRGDGEEGLGVEGRPYLLHRGLLSEDTRRRRHATFTSTSCRSAATAR